ncbi:hypothetical protein FNL37_1449 [Methylovorus glucosotrophus]|uniref:hypothetical protein n=1 Tax=Methylovorus glucosotrophus TaxID=266009 RepID=UPI0013316266|nr:hypothetical protein [Methylovorus glucosotrophus]KAF0844014.1 hypothetical protein FNL37_1449 [Methylovorus glucosotrophus]
MKNLPLLQETQFVVWAIPVLGFLLSIIFDWGYLNYFDIPFFYAEVNYYTASSSILSIAIICMVSFAVLSVGFTLSDHKNIFISFLFDRFIITFCFLLFLLTLAANEHLERPLYAYLAFIFFKVIYSLILFFGGTPLPNSLEQSSSSYMFDSKEAEDTADSASTKGKPPLQDSMYKLGSYIFVALIIIAFMSIAGSISAQFITQKWTISGKDNIVVIPRNNGIYLVKSFDPKTLVLDESIQVLSANEKEISLHPIAIDGKLIRKHQYDEQLKEEKRDKDFYEALTLLSSSLKSFFLNTHVTDWL